MNFAIGDLHNDLNSFNKVLTKIKFRPETGDRIYLVGDIFDRAEYGPQPFGLYKRIRGLGGNCLSVRGNHDQWLSDYIEKYVQTHNEKMGSMPSGYYNTFHLLKDRISEETLLEISTWIQSCPLQREVQIDGRKYLFAHAMTSFPDEIKDDSYYLMGKNIGFGYLKNGIDGYISVCGHNPTKEIRKIVGDDFRPKKQEIWINKRKNVYMIDCGCGFSDYGDRLGCICLETGNTYYVERDL